MLPQRYREQSTKICCNSDSPRIPWPAWFSYNSINRIDWLRLLHVTQLVQKTLFVKLIPNHAWCLKVLNILRSLKGLIFSAEFWLLETFLHQICANSCSLCAYLCLNISSSPPSWIWNGDTFLRLLLQKWPKLGYRSRFSKVIIACIHTVNPFPVQLSKSANHVHYSIDLASDLVHQYISGRIKCSQKNIKMLPCSERSAPQSFE